MKIRGIELDDRIFDPQPSAWPVPAEAPVLLFGGTFDPPHLAHVQLPVKARDVLFGESGWLVYIPAARSPHKSVGPVASDSDRVEMLQLATRDIPRCAIWTDEIDRARPGSGGKSGQPSYWIETLARAASRVGDGTPMRFLIGVDQVLAFDRWRAHETILALAEPLVLLREPITTREGLRRQLQMSGQDPTLWMKRVILDEVLPAASSAVRAALAGGDKTSGLLDSEVHAYIEQRGLYTNG